MGSSSIRPMAYRIKETGEIVKMERINSVQSVIHFKSGPERVREYELREGFEHIGNWKDHENGLTEAAND